MNYVPFKDKMGFVNMGVAGVIVCCKILTFGKAL